MNSRLLPQLRGFLEDLTDKIEKRRAWLLGLFTLLYFSVTCLLASRKLLWNDELFTLYISRLSSISEVWSALMTGAEQLPPFFYVVTRSSLALFGTSPLSIRLPEVIGFWILSVCLFRFVSKRTTALYGFLAMLFPLVTEAYRYAYEARPYGLVLGFSGLALICWQAAAEGDRRKLWLAGLALSLAAAASCHYYAVFAFLPLAFGEALRSLSIRRLNWPIWLAFVLGATPLIGFLSLIERAMGYSSTFWSKPNWMSIPNFYAYLLAPAVLPLMALVILSAIYPARGPRRQSPRRYSPPPHHEMAAAFGFMALPFLAVSLSMLGTGAFTDRYALPAVIGFSIVVAFATNSLLDDRAPVAAILLFSLCAFFLSIGARSFGAIAAVRQAQAQAIEFLQSEGGGDLPIAVSDQHTFISLAYYGPPDVASRVVYLADPEGSLRRLGHNGLETGMLDLVRPWFHLRVEEYDRFITREEQFLVYGSAGHFLNWLLSELVMADRRVELKGRKDDTLVLLVSRKGKSENSGNIGSPDGAAHD